jgi:hypothetical protein
MSQQHRSSPAWTTVTGLLAIVAIIGVIWLVLSNTAANSNPDQQSTVAVTPPEPNASVVGTDETPVASVVAPDLTSTRAAWETERSRFYTEIVSSPIATSEPAPTGIRDDEYARLEWAKQGLIVENSFGGFVDGNPVSIFAGAHASEPEQGVVQVVWVFPYRTFIERYPTPGGHGSVHITDEENNRLTLLSVDGTTFYFDIPALTFTTSLVEVVPTILPVPTYTPPVPPPTLGLPTAYPEVTTPVPASP